MGVEISGIAALLILALDIWAILNIVGSPATPGSKTLWVLAILLLPVLGVVFWLLLGPRSRTA